MTTIEEWITIERSSNYEISNYGEIRNKIQIELSLRREERLNPIEMLNEIIHPIVFDDNGNIGKRYRRQDEIGTPYCVTVDFDTVEKDSAVTVRDRDTGKQERVPMTELSSYFISKLS